MEETISKTLILLELFNDNIKDIEEDIIRLRKKLLKHLL